MAKPKKEPKILVELPLALLAFVIVSILSQATQQPISLNQGKGWDGVAYYSVAEQFLQGHSARADAPYVYRVGAPILAALLIKIPLPLVAPDDILSAFKVMNIIANLFATILLVLWLRMYLSDWRIRLILVLLFLTQWHGPIRFVYYYPVYVDPWFFVFLLAGLIGIHKAIQPTNRSIIWLAFLALVGTAFRESMFVVPVALLFVTNPVATDANKPSSLTTSRFARLDKLPSIKLLIPLVAAVLGVPLIRLVAFQTNDYSFAATALTWTYDKPLLAYLHAWFITFGPVIILTVYNWRRIISFLLNNQFMLIYLVAIAFLAWIGGSDTERILYWAMPVIYLLIGKSIEDHISLLKSVPLVVTLVLSQFVSQRTLWTIPNYPNEFVTPWLGR